jgi:hypothetical protein
MSLLKVLGVKESSSPMFKGPRPIEFKGKSRRIKVNEI